MFPCFTLLQLLFLFCYNTRLDILNLSIEMTSELKS